MESEEDPENRLSSRPSVCRSPQPSSVQACHESFPLLMTLFMAEPLLIPCEEEILI